MRIIFIIIILAGCTVQVVPRKDEIVSLLEPVALGVSGKLALSDGRVGDLSPGLSLENVVFSQSGRLLGGISNEGIFVWDMVNPPFVYRSLKTRISSLQFVNQETALLLGGVDGRVYRWKFLETDTPKKPSLERYIGHGSVVSAVTGGIDSPIFFSGDWLGVISVWLPYDADRFGGRFDENIFGGGFFTDINKVRETKKTNGAIESMIATQDRIFVGLREGKIENWSIRGLRKKGSVMAHSGGVFNLEAGSVLASSGRDGLIKLWTLDLEPLGTIEQRGVKALRLDDDNLFVLLESGSISKYPVKK